MRHLSIAMFLAFCPMMLTACGSAADDVAATTESTLGAPHPGSKASLEKSMLKARVGERVPQAEIVPARSKPVPAHKKR